MAKSLKTKVATTRAGSARRATTAVKRAPARRAQVAAERKPARRANRSSKAQREATVEIVKREGILPEPIATFTF